LYKPFARIAGIAVAASLQLFVAIGTAQAQTQDCDNLPFVVPDRGVTITLNSFERELLNLAAPGYIEVLKLEQEGALAGGYQARADGLAAFINISVPCIIQKINTAAGPGGDHAAGDVTVTFNNFERVAAQIMTRIWNQSDGVMSHHVNGCAQSAELRNGSLCPFFFPLGLASESLFAKVTQDQ
jgi:hypothetical protein